MSTVMKDLCSNIFLCSCDLKAFTTSIQHSKWKPLAVRCSKTFRCRNCTEMFWNLVKKVKKNCERCRYTLERKQSTLKCTQLRLTIYELYQHFMLLKLVDLCGPFKVYPPYNKRITIKTDLLSIAACLLQPHLLRSW